MNIGKRSILFLVLFVLLITTVIGCSTIENVGERIGSSDSSKSVLSSDLAVVELGKIAIFDEQNSTVAISYILRPGSSTEFDKQYYDVKILLEGQVVGGGLVRFQSPDFEFAGNAIILKGEAAKQFIKLLTETSEYQRLLRAFEKLQEEKREFHDKSEEMTYNLFWKGEAPSYDEYKKAMAQIKEMDAREKQIIQDFYEFPYSARLPSSFVSSLELVVEAK